MRTVAIDAFDVGEFPVAAKERLWLDAAPMLLGPVRIPVVVARGAQPGPTILAVAGVHGDEYEGMEAIRAVFAQLDVSRLRGTFVGIPVANPFAYEARTRIAPAHVDGLNLARIFPGDPDGSPSKILAHQILHLVLRTVGPEDLFLDFHSGSADVAFATILGFRDLPGAGRDRAEEAARHAGSPRLWRILDGPGPLNAETARRGVPTLGTETTGRAGCDPADVAQFTGIFTALMAHMGMVADIPAPPRDGGPARETVNVLAPATGFLRGAKRLDDEVRVGDDLGTIVDVFGDPIAAVTSPVAGVLWAVRSLPAVRRGELLYMIAQS